MEFETVMQELEALGKERKKYTYPMVRRSRFLA
ncbi:hypothetical protein SAMN04488168_106143 [Bacillus sp. 491mf]|nr:hypothetical protein SAMN04488168_106143 [Bacillus sp. 491mf]